MNRKLKQRLDKLRQQLLAKVEKLAAELAADVVTLFVYDEGAGHFHLPVAVGLLDRETFLHSSMRAAR
jgi:hypothetical protein